MQRRIAAILIALCLLIGIAGVSSLLSEVNGAPAGEPAPTPGATSTPLASSPTADASVMAGTPSGEAVTGTTGTPTVTTTEYFEQDPDPLLGVPAPPPIRTATGTNSPVMTTIPSASSKTVTSTQLPIRAGAERTPSVIETQREASSKSKAKPIPIHIRVQDDAFSPSSITVPAGAEVTIVFENQDVDTPHSVVIYADKTTPPLFVGTVIKGPGTTAGTFTAPSTPGAYILGCGVPSPHKKGTFIVQ